jgi:hypothetical protein
MSFRGVLQFADDEKSFDLDCHPRESGNDKSDNYDKKCRNDIINIFSLRSLRFYYGLFGNLEKSGLRFSLKAFRPSCPSSVI